MHIFKKFANLGKKFRFSNSSSDVKVTSLIRWLFIVLLFVGLTVGKQKVFAQSDDSFGQDAPAGVSDDDSGAAQSEAAADAAAQAEADAAAQAEADAAQAEADAAQAEADAAQAEADAQTEAESDSRSEADTQFQRTKKTRVGRFSASLSDKDTARITNDINSIIKECRALPAAYRADCLAQNLRETSKLVNKRAYSPVNRKLRSTSSRIKRVVSLNIDRSAPTIQVGGKKIRAVKKTAVAKTNRQVAKIITETRTVLIRSAGRSKEKKIHFTKIASVVDSTKVLLRSA